MRNSPRIAALVAVGLAALSACGGADGPAAEGPRVVTSIYPLQYVAERIAGEHAQVTNLTSPGVEPHDLELDVAQTAEISESDVAFYLKGFQPAVDEAIVENGPEHSLEAGEVVTLAPIGDHADESAEEHADHAHGDLDPHFWLDPARLDTAAEAFYREMVEVDPDHEDAYAAGYRDLSVELDRLDAEYERGLADCAVDTVVVSHDAFGYLGRYGLDFVAINGLSPDAEPSPHHIAKLHDLIRSEGITTVFSETLASPEMAETLARDLGLEAAVLDPIEGLGDATADEDYFTLMRNNLAALREANQCS